MIMQWLDVVQKGLVSKIELGGIPKVRHGKIVGIRNFRNKYYRKGMSDVLFIKNGITYFFEIKTPEVASELSKRYFSDKWNKYINLKSNERLKLQYEFLEMSIKHGARGGFVCCPEDVKIIIYDEDYWNKIYIPKFPND